VASTLSSRMVPKESRRHQKKRKAIRNSMKSRWRNKHQKRACKMKLAHENALSPGAPGAHGMTLLLRYRQAACGGTRHCVGMLCIFTRAAAPHGCNQRRRLRITRRTLLLRIARSCLRQARVAAAWRALSRRAQKRPQLRAPISNERKQNKENGASSRNGESSISNKRQRASEIKKISKHS